MGNIEAHPRECFFLILLLFFREGVFLCVFSLAQVEVTGCSLSL